MRLNKKLLILSCTFVFIFYTFAFADDVSTGTISGVIELKGETGYSGILVSINGLQQTTDSSGTYSFNLSTGYYVLKAEKEGYVTDYYEIAISTFETQLENYSLYKSTDNLFSLTQVDVSSGNIVFEYSLSNQEISISLNIYDQDYFLKKSITQNASGCSLIWDKTDPSGSILTEVYIYEISIIDNIYKQLFPGQIEIN